MRKKIIIFSSTGGGGHISVAKALTAYLQNDYDVQTVYPFLEILKPLDFIRIITRNRYNGEKIYNIFIQKNWFLLINIIYYIGKYYIKFRKKTIHWLFNAFMQEQQPDLLISVIPLLNGQILEVAQNADTPFLVIPSDLDATTFIQGLNNPTYEKFHMALAFDLPCIWKTVESACINVACFSIIGFPLRPGFFKTYDTNKIKKEFNIPKNKPVILFMMGAVGSQASIGFIKQLKTVENNCHLIICLGKNENIKNEIENIQLPSHITTTILGFTEKIPELMAISDLFITKSGTVSVCEAIYMNLPMLIDATSAVLSWEKFNHRLIKKQKFGDILDSKKEIAIKLDALLKHPERIQEYKKNLIHFEKKQFNMRIPILIQYMTSGKFAKQILELMYDFL